jgi:beta-lactamase class A
MAAAALAGWKGGTALAKGAADFDGLPAAFARIEATLGGRLGVSVLDTGSGQRAGRRQDERFPMCSTFKLLAAGAVLAQVDARKEKLDRRIVFGRQDLITWSPVTETQVGGAGMTLAALCEAAVILSDNTAANLLLGVLGGPAGLTAYLRGIGDSVTRLDRTEPSLNEALAGDPRDTTSPAAFLSTTQTLTLGSALSDGSRQRLQGWLRGNKTGDNRLRARLPQGWQAGEKTGTGANGTANDAGLLWPPGGAAPILVSAFLTGGSAKPEARDAALAEIGAAVAAAWRP